MIKRLIVIVLAFLLIGAVVIEPNVGFVKRNYGTQFLKSLDFCFQTTPFISLRVNHNELNKLRNLKVEFISHNDLRINDASFKVLGLGIFKDFLDIKLFSVEQEKNYQTKKKDINTIHHDLEELAKFDSLTPPQHCFKVFNHDLKAQHRTYLADGLLMDGLPNKIHHPPIVHVI